MGVIPKLSNWVLLGPTYTPSSSFTYCGCIKTSCPLLISYCLPTIVNSKLTPCHYLFANDLSFVYCLFSIVNCLLFITYYTSVETLTSIIQVSSSARLQEPIRHCVRSLDRLPVALLSDK